MVPAMKDDPHPLRKYLSRHKLDVPAFAAICGVSPRSIHYLMAGEHESPGIALLAAVEDATGGKVKILKQWEWLKRRKK